MLPTDFHVRPCADPLLPICPSCSEVQRRLQLLAQLLADPLVADESVPRAGDAQRARRGRRAFRSPSRPPRRRRRWNLALGPLR